MTEKDWNRMTEVSGGALLWEKDKRTFSRYLKESVWKKKIFSAFLSEGRYVDFAYWFEGTYSYYLQ